MEQFTKWCNKDENETSFEDLLKDSEELRFKLVEYLESYRVKEKSSGELIRPKAGYLTKLKSNLTTELTRLTGKI